MLEKFAESLEVIPLTLGQNAGMDPIDVLTDLRARQSKGSKWTGIDVRNARIADISKLRDSRTSRCEGTNNQVGYGGGHR